MTSRPWIDHANGVNTTHLYDAAGRPTVVTHLKAAGAVLDRITYTCDDVGNRESVTANDGSVTTYLYDNTYRLIDEWRTGANAYRTSHTYDPVGNRTVEGHGGRPCCLYLTVAS